MTEGKVSTEQNQQRKMTQVERLMKAPVLVDRKSSSGAIMKGFRESGMLHTVVVFRGQIAVAHSPAREMNSPQLLESLCDEGIKRIAAGQGVKIA